MVASYQNVSTTALDRMGNRLGFDFTTVLNDAAWDTMEIEDYYTNIASSFAFFEKVYK